MIGRQIGRARTERGLKLRELARRAEISPSSLKRIEADQVSPNVSTVRKLASALGIETEGLLGPPSSEFEASRTAGELDPEASKLIAAFERLDSAQRHLILGITEELSRLATEPATATESQRRVTAAPTPRAPATTICRHYVQGWDRITAHDHLDGKHKLGHTAGAQFSKPFEPIERGDVLWIVFVDGGRLHLLGRMLVASRRDYAHHLRSDRYPDEVIFSQREVERILNTRDVWPAPEHLLAEPRSAVDLRDIPVPTNVVKGLRFRTSSRITEVATDDSGRVQGQAFRSVRLLTPEAADLFEQLWATKPRARNRRS